MTGGRTDGERVEDAEVFFFRSDQDGQSQKGTPDNVGTCTVEGQWINWTKDVSDGAVRQDKKKDLRLHACSERGLKDRGGWQGKAEMEPDNPLQVPKGSSGKQKTFFGITLWLLCDAKVCRIYKEASLVVTTCYLLGALEPSYETSGAHFKEMRRPLR